MPTYVYEVIREDGQQGDRFEIDQRMTDDPLTVHPETGEPVRRLFLPAAINGRNSLARADKAVNDNRKLEQLGFTKYVKTSDGQYEKACGKGPDHLQR